MGQVISLPFKIAGHTKTFYFGLWHFLCGDGRSKAYHASSYAPLAPSLMDSPEKRLFKQHARIHLFSLASNFYLYNRPHYRKGSYRDDLRDNLRNVAVPGTGVPLSWVFGYTRWIGLPVLLTAYPLISGIAAIHHWRKTGASISEEYATRLLAPNDWFHYWRLNCTMVGLHSLLDVDHRKEYEMENKWTFLEEGDAKGVPVSPFLKSPSSIVVKHRNEEGGMGIFFYKNAVAGGDWIIQDRIENSDFVNSLLPSKAPLSTFRVISCSRRAFRPVTSPVSTSTDIESLSCVFRAGRQGAATDHDSILFDVDTTTGKIRQGTTNAHWYRLGTVSGSWRSYSDEYTHHPDGGDSGSIPVTGAIVPNIRSLLDLVEDSHAKMCPTVPICGWDVGKSSHGCAGCSACLSVLYTHPFSLTCVCFVSSVERPQGPNLFAGGKSELQLLSWEI
jgi:hypothetical protein